MNQELKFTSTWQRVISDGENDGDEIVGNFEGFFSKQDIWSCGQVKFIAALDQVACHCMSSSKLFENVCAMKSLKLWCTIHPLLVSVMTYSVCCAMKALPFQL